MLCRISLRTVWHARKVLSEYRFCRTYKKTRSSVERGLLLSFLVLQQVLTLFFWIPSVYKAVIFIVNIRLFFFFKRINSILMHKIDVCR